MSNSLIDLTVGGNDWSVPFSITIPDTETITKAWMTIRADPADPGTTDDTDAIVQKIVISSYIVGQGQITDAGTAGVALGRFDFLPVDTKLLRPVYGDEPLLYDIKALLSSGKLLTPTDLSNQPIRVLPPITVSNS